MMNQDTKKMMTKAAIAGAVNAAVGSYYFGGGAVTFFGTSVPAAVPLFAAGAGSSVITDMTHSYVLGMIPSNENYANLESTLLGVALSGAANVAIMAGTVSGVPSENYIPIAAIGGGSYVAGDYVANRLLSNDDNMLIF